MAFRIAVVNDKGGVGRTLLVRILAEYLARQDFNVLVVDLDHQAIVSRRLGYDMHNVDRELPNAYGMFPRTVAKGAAAELISPIRWDEQIYPWAQRIHLIPGHEDLVNVEFDNSGNPTGRVRRALGNVDEEHYDFTLFDTRPDMGKLSQAAWAASDVLLGVCAAWRDEMEGMTRVLRRVLDYREDLGNADLTVGGIVLNEYDPRSRHMRENVELLEDVSHLVLDPETAGREQYVWNDCPLPNLRAITAHMSEGQPLAAISETRTRVRIDDAIAPIVGKVLEVAGVSAVA